MFSLDIEIEVALRKAQHVNQTFPIRYLNNRWNIVALRIKQNIVKRGKVVDKINLIKLDYLSRIKRRHT